MEVRDAHRDERFIDNPLVVGHPGIRFYAGAPIRLADGFCVGSLCVIDRSPRKLSAEQLEILRQSSLKRACAGCWRRPRALGIDYALGFLMHRPAPLHDLLKSNAVACA